MPAYRLPASRAVAIAMRQYDVVGSDSPQEHAFVAHAALCRDDVAHAYQQARIPVVHMVPPLRQAGFLSPVDATATAELTDDECEQIRSFIDDVTEELAAQKARGWGQYMIYPDIAPNESDDGTVLYRRFSCSGFVRAAYEDAGITLLKTRSGTVPLVADVPTITLARLKRAYGAGFADRLDDPAERAKYGLLGDGPWPVVLPGYNFHAMNRPAAEIRLQPYLPKAGDEYFRG